MSMSPNNPFDAGQPQAGFDQPAPAKKSSAKFWLIGCGVTGILGVLVCCGGSLLMTQFGLSVLAGEFQKQLDGNPVIVEHVGEIESLDMSWGETMKGAQNAEGGAEELAFTIKGTKGSGVVLIQQDKSGDGTGMESATLVMDDGTRHPIDLGFGNDSNEVDLDSMFDDGDVPVEVP